MNKLLLGGAAAALSVAAFAQPAPPPPPGVASGVAPAARARPAEPHVRVMMMSDRTMTRADVSDHVAKLFARLDTNRDGFITKEEVEALHGKMMGAMAMGGDMQKRLGEHGIMMGDRGAMFDRLDTNHDGNISRQEFLAHQPEVRTERVMIMRGPDGAPPAPGMPPMPGGPGMHMHGMGMGMGGMGGHLFEMADTNHDGRVSLAEAQAAALAHFDKADLNHDGKITPDERQQMHKIRIERRQS